MTGAYSALLAGGAYCLASTSMVVANKAAIGSFPRPALLMLLQNAMTTAILLGTNFLSGAPEAGLLLFPLPDVIHWSPVVFLFFTNILTSIISLKFVSVATFVISRESFEGRHSMGKTLGSNRRSPLG